MPTIPAAIIDTLNGLLEAEVNSIFRFIGEGSPYLDNATAEIRKPLAELYQLGQEHIRELAELIESLGGVPRVAHRVRSEEQYLAFLSLKFLLPKLIKEKGLILDRYQDTHQLIEKEHPEIARSIARIAAEQRHYFDLLTNSAVQATRFPSERG